MATVCSNSKLYYQRIIYADDPDNMSYKYEGHNIKNGAGRGGEENE